MVGTFCVSPAQNFPGWHARGTQGPRAWPRTTKPWLVTRGASATTVREPAPRLSRRATGRHFSGTARAREEPPCTLRLSRGRTWAWTEGAQGALGARVSLDGSARHAAARARVGRLGLRRSVHTPPTLAAVRVRSARERLEVRLRRLRVGLNGRRVFPRTGEAAGRYEQGQGARAPATEEARRGIFHWRGPPGAIMMPKWEEKFHVGPEAPRILAAGRGPGACEWRPPSTSSIRSSRPSLPTLS